jgi:phosphoribosylpyrophosphate synthetase
MNITSKESILDYIKKNDRARVEDLRVSLGISRQLIHRQLNKLVDAGLVFKSGEPPLVFYQLSKFADSAKDQRYPAISEDILNYIDGQYLWVSPAGELLKGFKGFHAWAVSTNQANHIDKLSREYKEIREEANSRIGENGFISAKEKLESTFDTVALEDAYYLDFYSLPKFGKTRLGQLTLYAKQSQKSSLIQSLALEISPAIKSLAAAKNVDAIAFIPPTVPRKLQFLKELEKYLNLSVPKIELVKAYPGDVPVAQKTLSKLDQRIENAKRTIFIKDRSARFKKVLIIDDAVGSGASLNEVAKKMRAEGVAEQVYGVAIVGSYKGFDVISEI